MTMCCPQVREQREAEIRQLRRHSQALSREVERLDEEKTTLRKQLLDQAISSRKMYAMAIVNVDILCFHHQESKKPLFCKHPI